MAKVTPTECNIVVGSKRKENKTTWLRALWRCAILSLHLENDSPQIWTKNWLSYSSPTGSGLFGSIASKSLHDQSTSPSLLHSHLQSLCVLFPLPGIPAPSPTCSACTPLLPAPFSTFQAPAFFKIQLGLTSLHVSQRPPSGLVVPVCPLGNFVPSPGVMFCLASLLFIETMRISSMGSQFLADKSHALLPFTFLSLTTVPYTSVLNKILTNE